MAAEKKRLTKQIEASILLLTVLALVLACGSGGGSDPFNPVTPDMTYKGDTLSFSTASLPSVVIGTSYEATIAVSGGVAPYSFTIISGNLPEGLSFDNRLGKISGTPTGSPGSVDITVAVTDQVNQVVTTRFNITIANYISPLSITTASLPAGTLYTPYSQSVQVTGGEAPYYWAMTSGSLHSGLTFDTATGLISGEPVLYGVKNISITVTDLRGRTVTADYDLTVNIAALVITTDLIADGALDVGYESTIAASGGVKVYSFEISAGALHTGLSLDAVTGTISGTPVEYGEKTVTVKVTDSLGTAVTKNFTFQMAGVYISTTSPLLNGASYNAYTQTLAAGGDAGPYTWSLTSGSLPVGLSLDANTGEISGTPQIACSKTFTISVTNSEVTASREFTLAVLGDSWTATSTGANCPVARYVGGVVWTGTTTNPGTTDKMIVWGGYDGTNHYNDGGIYDPVVGNWAATSTGANCPTVRRSFVCVWTGDTGVAATSYKMIIWGGRIDAAYYNDGGVYDPATNSWAADKPNLSGGANCPTIRNSVGAVWTGNTGIAATSYKMIVWGGYNGVAGVNTGGVYDLATDTWAADKPNLSGGANCPTARYLSVNTAVWTGATGNADSEYKMIIWGGQNGGTYYNTGGMYDLATDTWVATSVAAGCPGARRANSVVWTGATGNALTENRMIIWGGQDASYYYSSGGVFDPSANTWVPTSININCPSQRAWAKAVWTGSHMIVWGGETSGAAVYNTGGVYNLAANTWTRTSVGANCPSARRLGFGFWMGKQMAVWGGTNNTDALNTGGIYTP